MAAVTLATSLGFLPLSDGCEQVHFHSVSIYATFQRSVHAPLAGMPCMVTPGGEEESLSDPGKAETCLAHYCIPKCPKRGLAQ